MFKYYGNIFNNIKLQRVFFFIILSFFGVYLYKIFIMLFVRIIVLNGCQILQFNVFIWGYFGENNNKDILCIIIRKKKIGIIDRILVFYVLN